MNSCIYSGRVSHHRVSPVSHRFSYRIFMLMLDLDELTTVFKGRWFWSCQRPNLAWFNRRDHYGNPDTGLADAIRDLVETRTGRRPAGPVRLLTHLRYFGHCFNPVSFYFCYEENKRSLQVIVAEVNNTPWGERYMYVLPCDAGTDGKIHRFELRKNFHVSPFMPMDIDYQWHFSDPGDRLQVFMRNIHQGKVMFDATLAFKRQDASAWNLAINLVRHPLVTLKVVAAIHFQALKLWLKGVPFYTHPRKANNIRARSSLSQQGSHYES